MPECHSFGVTGEPVRTSHTRAVRSSLPLLSQWPSGLNVTTGTPSLWLIERKSRPVVVSQILASPAS